MKKQKLKSTGWDKVKSNKCDGLCGWKQLVGEIEGLLLDGSYDYAEEWLIKVQDWIEKHQHVTEKQKQAVTNISSKPCGDFDRSYYDLD